MRTFMKVSSLMSRGVVSVQLDEPLSTIKRIFEDEPFHHILVVEKGILVGIISDRDLLKALSPNIDTVAVTTKELAVLNKRAHQIMSRDLIVLKHNSTVKEAIMLFHTHGISCLPVVNSDFKAVGILTWRDIIKALAKKYE